MVFVKANASEVICTESWTVKDKKIKINVIKSECEFPEGSAPRTCYTMEHLQNDKIFEHGASTIFAKEDLSTYCKKSKKVDLFLSADKDGPKVYPHCGKNKKISLSIVGPKTKNCILK